MPFWHCEPKPQLLPHIPQLVFDVWRFTHVVPQTVPPGGHEITQRPAVHVWPVGQALPHMPQFWLLVCVLMHAEKPPPPSMRPIMNPIIIGMK